MDTGKKSPVVLNHSCCEGYNNYLVHWNPEIMFCKYDIHGEVPIAIEEFSMLLVNFDC